MVCMQQNIFCTLFKALQMKPYREWYGFYYFSLLSFQGTELFSASFQLKHSPCLCWFHKWKEIRASPMQSNWQLIFTDPNPLGISLQEGWKSTDAQSGLLNWQKMLPFAFCLRLKYWKRKMTYWTFSFFHFHFAICKAECFLTYQKHNISSSFLTISVSHPNYHLLISWPSKEA